MKQIQIGIMGSAADLNYSEDTLKFAKKLGKLIAKSGNILVYGAEKEYTSLSTEAAKEASKYGGITVGVAGGKSKDIYGEYRPTILINSGLEIGGGREFTLVLSCDVINRNLKVKYLNEDNSFGYLTKSLQLLFL